MIFSSEQWNMISLGWFKALSAISIWVLGFLGALGPLIFQNINSRVLSVLNIFAGGIFLACSILHLLADAVDNQALAAFGGQSNNFGAYFFYGIGFLLILLIEMFTNGREESSLEKETHKHTAAAHEQLPLFENMKKSSYSFIGDHPGSSDTLEEVNNIFGDTKVITFVVFISLSFHSIMEGVAIGVQTKLTWDIFLAVIAHKGLAAFALGLELMSHSVSRVKFLCFITSFSLMSPLGIWVGSLTVTASSEQGTDSLASGICTAMSGGTFLFVAVMEIIPQELKNRQDQLSKSIALCLGFGFFGLLAIWT